MQRVAILVGSTRPGRKGAAVARWVEELARTRSDASYELVDLAEFALPQLDEPQPAATGVYHHSHTKRWATVVEAYDAYVFVTPEYNHSIPGGLKTAIDFVYREWNDKAAGFVGYGVNGGVRAVEHLRQIMAEVRVAGVRAHVGLSLFTDFSNDRLAPAEHQERAAHAMLDELLAWSESLNELRRRRLPDESDHGRTPRPVPAGADRG